MFPYRILVLALFLFNSLGYTSTPADIILPPPGSRVPLSPVFRAATLKGIKLHKDHPFQFDFILDHGDSRLSPEQLNAESAKFIKYFMAGLTVPDEDQWVNLSPFEQDRVMTSALKQTDLGRDLLAQDYLLKQVSASLLYPDGETGKVFWQKIYAQAGRRLGTTAVPVATYNKVWIVPDTAVVYEDAQSGAAYVVESKLKVLLEEDYLALSKQGGRTDSQASNALGSNILREVVLPVLNDEVNQGKNFAELRAIYNSLILAAWYKDNLKDGILERLYRGKNKLAGIRIHDSDSAQKIYGRYVEAFKRGTHNFIKEEKDRVSGQSVPRKYFSGGASMGHVRYRTITDPAQLPADIRPLSLVKSRMDADQSMAAPISSETLLGSLSKNPEITWQRIGPFYSVNAPWRSGRRGVTAPQSSVTAPFNPAIFHFSRPPHDDYKWNFDEQEVFWEGEILGRSVSFIEQKWPYALRQFLIVPERRSQRAQILKREDIRMAVEMVREQIYPGLRIGFNSLTAGASVNHLHLHAMQLPEDRSALEEAPIKQLYVEDAYVVYALSDYPAQGVFIESADPDVLSTAAYKYIRSLQAAEIAHSVVFSPRGVYVLPERSNHITSLGNTWTFYELQGFVINASGEITEENIRREMEGLNIPPDQFEATHKEAFGNNKNGERKFFPEHIIFEPKQRFVTKKDIHGHVTIRPEFENSLGKLTARDTAIKTFDSLGVLVVLNRARAGREVVWEQIKGDRECTLCGLLKHTEGAQLGIGNGFLVVPEILPYFNNTGMVVHMDHRASIMDRGLIMSMAQLLHELGPFGFRIAYNYRDEQKSIIHQSYKVFQREMPIESAAMSRVMTFPDISISTIEGFPTKALVLETKSADVLVNELLRLQEFLEMLRKPFHVLLSRRVDGTIRAFVILRTKQRAAAFNNKHFAAVEGGGVLILENEEDFNDPRLEERVKSAYQEITPHEGIGDLVYAYKMHMALGRLGIEHTFDYQIDASGTWFYVCRVEGAGEVVKASKHGLNPDAQKNAEWERYFQTGYDVARSFLDGVISPFQGVDINERGEFIPSPDNPSYVVQKIVEGDTAFDQVMKGRESSGRSDVPYLLGLYEGMIGYFAELLKRGTMDIDFKNFLGNFRGTGAVNMGFDISHLRAVNGGVNIMGSNGYLEDMEEEFKYHIQYVKTFDPQLGAALEARFGHFSWAKELERRGIRVPSRPEDGPGKPMAPWTSKIVELSQRHPTKDAALISNGIKGGIDMAGIRVKSDSQSQSISLQLNDTADPLPAVNGFTPVVLEITPIRSLRAVLKDGS